MPAQGSRMPSRDHICQPTGLVTLEFHALPGVSVGPMDHPVKLRPGGPQKCSISKQQSTLVTLVVPLLEAACKKSWARGRAGAGLRAYSNQQLGPAHRRVERQLDPRPGLFK